MTSFSPLSAPRRVIGTYLCFLTLTFLFQSTNSEDIASSCLFSFLLLIHITIIAFFVETNVSSFSFIPLGTELLQPVVELGWTDAPTRTMRSLFRARESFAIPSAQSLLSALRVIVCFFTTGADKTLAFLYLLRHTRDQLADIYLAAPAGPWAWTAEVLNVLSGVADVVKTKVGPTSPPELALVPDHLLTAVEPFATHPSSELLPSLSPTCSEYLCAGETSAETRSTSPSPANATTSLSGTNGPTAPPYLLPSLDFTSSIQTLSNAISGANLDGTDEKASTPASIPNEPCHSSVALAAVASGAMPQPRSKLGTSSVPFPSLPPPPGDDQPPRADSRGQVSRDVERVSLPLRRSRKIALQKFDIVNPSEWRGISLHEVAVIIARGRASATFPRIIDKGLLTPSLSSDDGKHASTISDSPTLTQSTPATSVELLYDHKRETGAPTPISSSTFESPGDTQVLDAKSVARKAPVWETEETVGGFWDDVRVLDRFSSNRDRRRKLRWNVPEHNAEEDWKWAKTKGKKPVGGRGPLVVSKPALAPPTTLVSTGGDEDEEGFSKIQEQQAKEASRKPMAMPFYGASTSRAFQPLSDQEWALLEQFEVTASSSVETVRPQSVLLIDFDTEVVQSSVPPPPPTPDAAPAKIKEASRAKKVFKKIMKRFN